MNPLHAVFRLSLTVLLRSRRTVMIGLLCYAPVLISVLGSAFILSGVAPHELTGFSLTSFMIVNGYVYVLLMVVTLFYGTALVSDELEDKTITYLFIRPVPKRVIYLGKYLAYLAAAGLLLLPSATLCFLIAMTADPAGEAGRHVGILLQDLVVLALGIASYGALFAWVGAVTARPVFIGLGFTFVWETLVTFIPGYLSKLTIKHYLSALLPHAVGERGVLGLFENPTSAPAAVVVLCLVTAGLLALGSWSFTHREYVLEQ
ncbi:MAG TPA: ABC transporter permease [Candidatus Polarisedimenticolia bacterium]|nr:ABC transporter permease [Candidatus Polarisedimenticolia bacterium]